MNIVFCASEVVPFAKTGGLADVCGALPPVLEKLGHNVIIITPRYKNSTIKTPTPMVRIGDNVKVYFIEHQQYFGRDGLYGDTNGDFIDNLERFSYFCHAALKLLKEIRFKPDIIHCHDWHTALIPILLKTNYLLKDPFFKNACSVLTIHNLAYQGIFPKDQYARLGIDGHLFHTQGIEFYEKVNMLKGGIIFADAITTVSPQYAKEIQNPEFGCGLEGVLKNRSHHIFGILNGLDYDAWNPKDDPFLDYPFSPGDLIGKAKNKSALLASLNLPDEGKPLFGFVARLCHQKGVDIIAEAIDDMVKLGAQLVFTGVGEKRYHRVLEEAARKYPKSVGLYLSFDEKIAHRIYAASDFFLMPSVFEPCGLGQMIALRYGSVPLVYKTGGLSDTISLYDSIHQTGNGFLFTQYSKPNFVKAVGEAIKVYKDKKQMTFLANQTFRYKFHWEKSAREYLKVYQQCLS